MMFNRRHFLLSSLALMGMPGAVRAAVSSARPRRLVYVFADGGWDTSFCLEPKFGSPEVDGPWVDEQKSNPDDREYEAPYGDYSVVLNDYKRPSVTSFFESYGSRCSIVSGIWTGAIAHDTSRVRILTGSPSSTRPDLNSIVGSVHGVDRPLGSIDLSGLSLSGHLAASTGQVGYQSQIATLLDPYAPFPASKDADRAYPLHVPAPEDRDAVRAFLKSRAQAFGAQHADSGRNDQRIADRMEAMDRADRFLKEGTSVLASLVPGGRPSLELQVTLGLDLLEKDLCRSVMMETTQHWDSHDENVRQHDYYESTFRGLTHLAEQLDAKGLAEDTLVVVISEMTRTPRINARSGKDHWPHCSALLMGAGFPVGRRFGATNDQIESEHIQLTTGEITPSGDLLKYDNFAAGLLAGMDIDPGDWFPGTTPFTGWMNP